MSDFYKKAQLKQLRTSKIETLFDCDAARSCEELAPLTESIRNSGVMYPIVVAKEKRHYILISGNRRLAAAKFLNLKKIPAVVVCTDRKTAMLISLTDSIYNEPRSSFYTAEQIGQLNAEQTDCGELAATTALSEAWFYAKLTLLTLSEPERALAEAARISEPKLHAVAGMPETERKRFFDTLSHKLSPAAKTSGFLKKLVKNYFSQFPPKKQVFVKDVRIFLNTVLKAVDMMRQSGINATAVRRDKPDCVEYIVRIPIADSASESKTG
ncbi:MAG: ParB/RepB/Spo0J family partition protein [Oscillospiraceae bacterium]